MASASWVLKLTQSFSLSDITNAMQEKDIELYRSIANLGIPSGVDIWRKKYPEDFPDMFKPIAREPVEYWIKPRLKT